MGGNSFCRLLVVINSPENAKNIPESEVVVLLLGQLLLAQRVQHVELPREV